MPKAVIPKEAKYTVWLNEHEREVNKYSGKWIAVRLSGRICGVGDNPSEARHQSKEKYPGEKILLYHVPRPDEGNYVL